jgi:CubicO group peptidase (beta-lactamase class C family)
MGFAVLGEIIRSVAGRSCADFLRTEIFEPLWMNDTSLGAPEDWFSGPDAKGARIAEIRVPDDQRDSALDWGWNSRYWRGLGAPWGGVFSTPADLARFARMMLSGGSLEGTSIFSKAIVSWKPPRETSCSAWRESRRPIATLAPGVLAGG